MNQDDPASSISSVHELRIGFAGHRRNKLDQPTLDRVSVQITLILTTIASSTNRPVRFVTSLADGSDLAAATSALNLGIPIECHIPFGVDEFRCDLDLESDRNDYDRLIAQAVAVRVVEGTQTSVASRMAAYSRVADSLVDQIELLIVVWDGLSANGPGGTADVVERALRHSIAVLRIDSTTPERVSLSTDNKGLLVAPVDDLVCAALVNETAPHN